MRADFIRVLTICEKNKQLAPPATVRKKEISSIFPLFPTTTVRQYSQSEHILMKIEDDALENEVGSSFSV